MRESVLVIVFLIDVCLEFAISTLTASLKEYAQAEGVSAGFGVDSELVSDLSRGIGVLEMVEYWEKVQRTSARPHVDLIPSRNGTGMHLMHADT